MRRPALAFVLLLGLSAPAAALVGGAAEVRDAGAGRHIVMIISTRGNFCTATALARDLVLTAGHCVAPAATYRVLIDQPPGIAIRSIVVHPRYSSKDYAGGRVTADVALIQLDAPLPDRIIPATLGEPHPVAPGDRLVVAGYGVTTQGSAAGGGTPRAATLVATGKPGNLQIRLHDPATRGQRAGLGACTGDSGAPVFVERDVERAQRHSTAKPSAAQLYADLLRFARYHSSFRTSSRICYRLHRAQPHSTHPTPGHEQLNGDASTAVFGRVDPRNADLSDAEGLGKFHVGFLSPGVHVQQDALLSLVRPGYSGSELVDCMLASTQKSHSGAPILKLPTAREQGAFSTEQGILTQEQGFSPAKIKNIAG